MSGHAHPPGLIPHNEPHPDPSALARQLADVARQLADVARQVRQLAHRQPPPVDDTRELTGHLAAIIADLADVVAQLAQTPRGGA